MTDAVGPIRCSGSERRGGLARFWRNRGNTVGSQTFDLPVNYGKYKKIHDHCDLSSEIPAGPDARLDRRAGPVGRPGGRRGGGAGTWPCVGTGTRNASFAGIPAPVEFAALIAEMIGFAAILAYPFMTAVAQVAPGGGTRGGPSPTAARNGFDCGGVPDALVDDSVPGHPFSCILRHCTDKFPGPHRRGTDRGRAADHQRCGGAAERRECRRLQYPTQLGRTTYHHVVAGIVAVSRRAGRCAGYHRLRPSRADHPGRHHPHTVGIGAAGRCRRVFLLSLYRQGVRQGPDPGRDPQRSDAAARCLYPQSAGRGPGGGLQCAGCLGHRRGQYAKARAADRCAADPA